MVAKNEIRMPKRHLEFPFPYSLQIASRGAQLAVLVVFYLAIKQFNEHDFHLSVALCAMGIALLVNILSVEIFDRLLIQPTAYIPFFALLLVMTTINEGPDSILWAFPLIVGVYSFTTLKIAAVTTLVYMVAASGALLFIGAYELAPRFIIAVLFCAFFSHHASHYAQDLQDKLDLTTRKDALTGCYNQRILDVLKSVRTAEDQKGALLVIDIDRFKQINDQFGHSVGDRALLGVVQAIKAKIRKDDVLIRVGGEEFAVLLFNDSMSDAYDIAERIRCHVAKSARLPEREITVSIGIGLFCSLKDFDGAFQQADKLLLQAKETGRNRTCPDFSHQRMIAEPKISDADQDLADDVRAEM